MLMKNIRSLTGSSPRMRGAPFTVCVVLFCMRIIPADAGSTVTGESGNPTSKDHPRGCGEHFLADEGLVGRAGSSPRMRGALTLTVSSLISPGIIPADAGSTSISARHGLHEWDHPRGCGEHT